MAKASDDSRDGRKPSEGRRSKRGTILLILFAGIVVFFAAHESAVRYFPDKVCIACHEMKDPVKRWREAGVAKNHRNCGGCHFDAGLAGQWQMNASAARFLVEHFRRDADEPLKPPPEPLFVDPAKGDYHLKYGSPCIDAGTTTTVPGGLPEKDFEGDSRILGGGVDMGADEYGTHLYFMGVPSPGSMISLRIIGEPGDDPVGLFISEKELMRPLNTPYGTWHLEFPVYGPILLGPVPGDGVILVYGVLPPDLIEPYTLDFQALVQDELTNLSVMEVE